MQFRSPNPGPTLTDREVPSSMNYELYEPYYKDNNPNNQESSLEENSKNREAFDSSAQMNHDPNEMAGSSSKEEIIQSKMQIYEGIHSPTTIHDIKSQLHSISNFIEEHHQKIDILLSKVKEQDNGKNEPQNMNNLLSNIKRSRKLELSVFTKLKEDSKFKDEET